MRLNCHIFLSKDSKKRREIKERKMFSFVEENYSYINRFDETLIFKKIHPDDKNPILYTFKSKRIKTSLSIFFSVLN